MIVEGGLRARAHMALHRGELCAARRALHPYVHPLQETLRVKGVPARRHHEGVIDAVATHLRRVVVGLDR